MKCKKCGMEFTSFFSDSCPYCGSDNQTTVDDIISTIFTPLPDDKPKKEKSPFDPYDWDDPNNCSEREYDDDDDYDDFDEF